MSSPTFNICVKTIDIPAMGVHIHKYLSVTSITRNGIIMRHCIDSICISNESIEVYWIYRKLPAESIFRCITNISIIVGSYDH